MALRSHPVNMIDARDHMLEMLSEDIRGIENELADKRTEYARLLAWSPVDDYDADERPKPDGRMFDLGTDESEQWRPDPGLVVPEVADVVVVGERL